MNKGEYKGRCNFTACQSGKPATWWHFSTQRYYCEDCARMLNRENEGYYSLKLYGHALLVPVEAKQALPQPQPVGSSLDSFLKEEGIYEECAEKAKEPQPEARDEDIADPREFAERLAWMTVDGKPDLDQWANHIKHRDNALLRLAVKEPGKGDLTVNQADLDIYNALSDLSPNLSSLNKRCAIMDKIHALSRLAAKEGLGWIGVKDRLPEKSKWVAAIRGTHHPFTARLVGKEWWDCDGLLRDPDHWMPLPPASATSEKPEEER